MGDGDLTFSGVTDEAVAAATGRGWVQWFRVLDAAGAGEWDHKSTVAYLESEHPRVSAWWRQSITVAFEQARGKREVGQTADAGYQVGVQRTVAAGLDDVWELLVSRPELWLGAPAVGDVAEPGRYEVQAVAGTPGASGEVRVVRPGRRLRMTWQPDGWSAPATLQLTLSTAGSGRTRIGAHLEKLPDAQAREVMRAHWRAVLDRVVGAAQE
jgi:uncharacterized protein YndB with AHSA1/START domain